MLDSYLVKIGVKGQEVVLSEMDKIQKKGDNLEKKKIAVELAAKTTEKKVKEKVEKITAKPSEKIAKKSNEDLADKISRKEKTKTERLAEKTTEKAKKEKTTEEKEKTKKSDKDKKSTDKFSKSVDKFGNTTTSFARSASSLDPASAIQSGLSELGKIVGIGALFATAAAGLSAATGTISMAKAQTAAQYRLAQRNAMAGYYGKNISFGQKEISEADKTRISELDKSIKKFTKERQADVIQKSTPMFTKIGDWTVSKILGKKNIKATEDEKNQKMIRQALKEKYGIQEKYAPKWSNEEMAMLRTSVGQAYGRIQQPLADAINQFTMSNQYDPAALARIAAGNWRSAGTDTGWFLQQITDSLGDVPPTIAQKLQASLLKRYGVTEIQKTTEEQKEAQTINAAWANRNEQQIEQIFNAIGKSANELLGLNNKLKELQVKMISAGTGIATALNFVGNQITAMSHKVKTGN